MKWISIKDRLPILETDDFKHYESIDVITYDGDSVFVSEFSAGRSPMFWREFECGNITDWMPLPSPPQQQEPS